MAIELKEAFHDAFVRLENDPENAATGAVTTIQVTKEVWFEDTAAPGVKMNAATKIVASDLAGAFGLIGPTDCAGMLALVVGRAVALSGTVLADGLDAALVSNSDLLALQAAVDAEVTSRGL